MLRRGVRALLLILAATVLAAGLQSAAKADATPATNTSDPSNTSSNSAVVNNSNNSNVSVDNNTNNSNQTAATPTAGQAGPPRSNGPDKSNSSSPQAAATTPDVNQAAPNSSDPTTSPNPVDLAGLAAPSADDTNLKADALVDTNAALSVPGTPVQLAAVPSQPSAPATSSIHRSVPTYLTTNDKTATPSPAAPSTPPPAPTKVPLGDGLQNVSTWLKQIVMPLTNFGYQLQTAFIDRGTANLNRTLVLFVGLAAAVSLFVMWLQRSGFAHAARSDATAAVNFATHNSASYQMAYGYDNSLFFGVRNIRLFNAGGEGR